MNDQYSIELRRIRITLVILTIIMLFVPGSRTITVDNLNQLNEPYKESSNMVPLDHNHFGVLTSDSEGHNKRIQIYYYDQEKNKLTFKTEKNIN